MIIAIDFLIRIGSKVDNGWQEKVIPFLNDFWPQESHCKSEAVTITIVRMLGCTGDLFPEALNSIAHLLVPVSTNNIDIFEFHGAEPDKSLTLRFPQETLKMLHLVITDSIETKPYGLDEVMKYLTVADPKNENDSRYQNLQKIIARVGSRYG